MSGGVGCPRPSIRRFSVLYGMGKVYAVERKLSEVGPSGHLPNKSTNSAGFIPTLPRVTRSKRRVASVEIVFSDDPIPNSDHPLASLSPLDRHRHRLLKLAEILAQAAARRATRLTSYGKEAV